MSYRPSAAGGPSMESPSSTTHRHSTGPLQARLSPNGQARNTTGTNGVKIAAPARTTSKAPSSYNYHQPSAAGASTAPPRVQAARQAPAPPRVAQPSAHHPQHPAQSATQQQPQTQQQHAPSANRPQSRLEREKKKDYKDPPNIGPWKLGKLIGQGASGRVRLAEHSVTGKQAAVKIVPRHLLASSRMSLGELSQKQDKLTLGIEREIVIMKLIEHPNLLGLWDVYETTKELFLVMEYVAGGELFDHLVQKGRLRSSEARSYFRQIIFGVDYCHRFNICHRDLKPENLLLDGTKKQVKVADFGMAALQPLERMLETSCGSPHYASPEIVSGKSYKGSASDIWSCGVILFALLCGRLPFDDPNIGKLLAKVRDGRFEMPEGLEREAKDLIWRMLEVDPEKRLKMPEIMRHPWFTNHGSESSTNPSGPGAAMLGTEVQLTEGEIDVEILKNLKSLWPENSSRHIVKQLTSPGSNWQKTFYSLLVQHRDNHSSDDDEDSESEDEQDGAFAKAPSSVGPTVGASPNPGAHNSLGLSLGINVSAPTTGARPPSIRIQEQVRPVRIAEPASSVTQGAKPPLLRATTDQNSSPRRNPIPPPSPRIASAAAPSSQANNQRPGAARTYSDAPRSPGRPPAGPRPAPPPSPNPARVSVDVGRSPPSAYRAPATPSQPSGGADLSRRMTSPSHRKPSADDHQDSAYDTSDKVAAAAAVRASMASPTSKGRRPLSVNAPSIAVPQVGDATVQRFFQEIAAELASIRAASPTMAQQSLGQHQSQSQQQQRRRISQDVERSIAGVVSPTQGQTSVRLAPSPVPPASRTPDLVRNDEHSQFDDADEELAMYADQISILSSVMAASEGPSINSPYTPVSSPLPPAHASSPSTKPLSLSDKTANNRLSAHRGVPGGLFAGRPVSPAPSSANSSSRPTSYAINTHSSTSPENTSPQMKQSGGFMKRRSLLGLRKQPSNISSAPAPETSKRTSSYETQQCSPQEKPSASPAHPRQELTPLQTRLAQNASTRPTRLQQRNPGLGLDLTQQQQQNPHTPSIQSPTAAFHGNAVPTTPLTGPTAKQSWFAGLFNWKATSLHLNSLDGFVGTQMEVKRLLLSSGAKVFIEDSEALGSWRCSLKDNNSKTLRFRIEFNIAASPSGSSILASPALSVPGTPMSARGGMPAQSPALSSHSRYSGADMLSAAGYSTKVTFTLEKGNSQAFKNMYSQLRKEWTLDSAGPAGANGAQYSPAMVGLGVNM